LRDYASRLQGECLVMVSKNFSDAWNKNAPKPIERDNDPKKPPAHLTKGLGIAPHSAQIVRTEPSVKERTIERMYYQIASSARNYLYLENQYFQYAPFLQHLKKERSKYVKGHRAGNTPQTEVPMLHVMVITCLPEKNGMIPRMHDAITELGYGSSMPKQAEIIETEIRNMQQNSSNYESPQSLSKVAQSYLASGGGTADETIPAQLTNPNGQYAMRPLLACLCSFNKTAIEDAERAYKDYIAARKAYDAEMLIYKDEYERWVKRGSIGAPPQPSKRITAQLQATKKDLYQEVYIHSKLVITDDSFVTLGSANMNLRSYYSDSEINVGCDDPGLAAALRQRVWGGLAGAALNGGAGKGQDLEDTVEKWLKLIKKNGEAQDAGNAIEGLLVPFLDARTSSLRLG
jgi:phosphatidylserine/phosphatidylglycerophosphate/cardiolipin synthase-like enzyme